MADVGRVRVAVDVGRPLELGGVGVARAHVAGLELLELLLRAELVGLREKERLVSCRFKMSMQGSARLTMVKALAGEQRKRLSCCLGLIDLNLT